MDEDDNGELRLESVFNKVCLPNILFTKHNLSFVVYRKYTLSGSILKNTTVFISKAECNTYSNSKLDSERAVQFFHDYFGLRESSCYVDVSQTLYLTCQSNRLSHVLAYEMQTSLGKICTVKVTYCWNKKTSTHLSIGNQLIDIIYVIVYIIVAEVILLQK